MSWLFSSWSYPLKNVNHHDNDRRKHQYIPSSWWRILTETLYCMRVWANWVDISWVLNCKLWIVDSIHECISHYSKKTHIRSDCSISTFSLRSDSFSSSNSCSRFWWAASLSFYLIIQWFISKSIHLLHTHALSVCWWDSSKLLVTASNCFISLS